MHTHSREAQENRRKNIETDHARNLIYGIPLKDERETSKHFLVHPIHCKDNVWDVIESNRAASMAPLPNRRSGKRHFGNSPLVHSRVSPYGTAATVPDSVKPRLRQVAVPQGKESHRPRKRTGYPQHALHRNRNVAFGDFGPPTAPHYGKGGYQEHDRKAVHDHIKVRGIVPETPQKSELLRQGKRQIKDHNREAFNIITNEGVVAPSPIVHTHRRAGRRSIINHVVGDHTSTLPSSEAVASAPAPPGLPQHHSIRSGAAPHLKDKWLDDTRPRERQHKLAIHDHNAEHIKRF